MYSLILENETILIKEDSTGEEVFISPVEDFIFIVTEEKLKVKSLLENSQNLISHRRVNYSFDEISIDGTIYNNSQDVENSIIMIT